MNKKFPGHFLERDGLFWILFCLEQLQSSYDHEGRTKCKSNTPGNIQQMILEHLAIHIHKHDGRKEGTKERRKEGGRKRKQKASTLNS
jgi:hypothetical protein